MNGSFHLDICVCNTCVTQLWPSCGCRLCLKLKTCYKEKPLFVEFETEDTCDHCFPCAQLRSAWFTNIKFVSYLGPTRPQVSMIEKTCGWRFSQIYKRDGQYNRALTRSSDGKVTELVVLRENQAQRPNIVKPVILGKLLTHVMMPNQQPAWLISHGYQHVPPISTHSIQPSTSQQALTQQSMTQQPMTQQPMTQQPLTQQPMTQQPMNQQPLTQQPMTQQSMTQPLTQQLLTQQPMTQSVSTQTTMTQSVATQTSPLQPSQPLATAVKRVEEALDKQQQDRAPIKLKISLKPSLKKRDVETQTADFIPISPEQRARCSKRVEFDLEANEEDMRTLHCGHTPHPKKKIKEELMAPSIDRTRPLSRPWIGLKRRLFF